VNRSQTIAAMAAFAIVLAACGPAGSNGSGEPSIKASTAASSVAQASAGGPQASFGEGVVAELEALIPDKVGELTMKKSSFRGSDYLLAPGSDPDTVKFIQDLGVSPSDISMAIGFGFSADFTSSVAMFVFRAKGANSGALVTAVKASLDSSGGSPEEWSSATVGGKQVETAGQDGGSTFLYVKGDVLIWLTVSDPATAATILNGLP